jgi:hypothetical protein
MQYEETFRDHSTHLEDVFAAASSDELSNKMVSYMMNQKILVIKTFYFSSGSCVALL